MTRILVIDDDRVQRMIAAQALQRAGHEVVEAADGLQGLETVRAGGVDLIVCDVVMPGLNGYQFVGALRQEEGISAIPVIMLTSMNERAQMRAGMNAGADDYIAKPFSFEELNEAVDALLAKRRTLQEGLISSMTDSFVTALEEQRESLAAQYEERLVREVNARWDAPAGADAQTRYEHAVVLRARVAPSLQQKWASSRDAVAKLRSVHDAIRDALHLFNAAHLLPSGNDVLAIYHDEPGSLRVRATVRSVRAAHGLLQALARLRGTDESTPAGSVALHCGPVTVARMTDPLHGGPDSSLATGPTVGDVDAMTDFATAAQWGIAATPMFVGEMAGQLVTGRSAQCKLDAGSEPIDVIEVLGLK